jgi:hypothetical protein
MRLGILGPAQGDLPALARRAQHLIDVMHVDKVIYLADDGALDRVVASWARDLVGSDPAEEALFVRATLRCVRASAEVIEDFVASERARLRLKVFESLPSGSRRSIELLEGRVVLFVYDKATLDEEDIAAASILVFGKSPDWLIKKVGPRLFLSPGPIGSENGGSAVLDELNGGVHIEIMNASGTVTAEELFGAPQAARLRVQGGPNG